MKFIRNILGLDFIYKVWKKLLTFIGDIYFATELPKTKAKQIRESMFLIKKGDIICRKYNYYLDSYFIPGKYSHSGLVISKNNMIHAIAEGVEEIDFIDFIKDTDGFIILRPEYKNDELAKTLIFAYNQIGKPYDFLFERNKKKDAFYCHELVYYSLLSSGIKVNTKKEIIEADDFINSFKVVYKS